MRKLILALSVVFVLASFTNNTNKTVVLRDIDGTLLQSYPVIEQINGGLKSGLSYLGCRNINEVHKKAEQNEIKFNIVTSIGMSETGIRVKTY